MIKTHRDATREFSSTHAAGNENEKKKRHRKRGKEGQMVWSVSSTIAAVEMEREKNESRATKYSRRQNSARSRQRSGILRSPISASAFFSSLSYPKLAEQKIPINTYIAYIGSRPPPPLTTRARIKFIRYWYFRGQRVSKLYTAWDTIESTRSLATRLYTYGYTNETAY